MLPPNPPESGVRNHPAATRMAVIAFINYNIIIAAIFGSFSVLLGPVQMRLHVGPALSALGVPAVTLAAAICAPVVGALAARLSLRLIMLTGAILGAAGFALLAFTASFAIYLVAYGLLLGPAMAVGAIMPATLVTRWFSVNRGRTLGIVCAPMVIVIVPLLANWVLTASGAQATYLMLTGLALITVAANFFIRDYPPGMAPAASSVRDGAAPADVPGAGVGMGKLLAMPRFWALTLAFVPSVVASIVLTAHMVPIAKSWGFPSSAAAGLLSVQSLAGIGGTVLLGWAADRIGGALTLAGLLLTAAVAWVLLVTHPPFVFTAVLVAVSGMAGAGAVPVVNVAIAEIFGRESFSRVYGLLNLLNLPFYVVSVPAAGLVYSSTGSYNGALIGVAAFLVIGTVSALLVMRGRMPAEAVAIT